jgi:pyruvate dehydrogenase E2 component (dihydrolipoamide acetyltransferase)
MAEQIFKLPDLGEGLEEAEVVRWLVAEGDRIELDQPLVEVLTAKANVEIPSPFEGIVGKIHAREGEVVAVGADLVTFELGAATVEVSTEEDSEPPRVLVGYGVKPRPSSSTGRPRLRPPEPGRGRRERSGAPPSGVGSSRDEAVKAPPDERIPLRGVRRLIAQHMTASWTQIPHVTSFLTLDATELEAFRRELAEDTGVRVSVLPVVVRALVEVCREHPKLNSSFSAETEEIVLRRSYHVGIATETGDGLLVPVVRNVDGKGIVTVAREIAEVVAAAREQRATPDMLTGSTITVTNTGTFGAEFGTPIINAPEATILAIGVVEPRPLAVDGELRVRLATTLSLSFDHRVLDGGEAGRAFLALRDLLSRRERLRSLPRD